MMLCRALIKTHHMTSRKKIMAITKAAKQYDCAIYLKSGKNTPGVMIGECDGEEGERDLKELVKSVKVGLSCSLNQSAIKPDSLDVPGSFERTRWIEPLTDLDVLRS